MRSISLCLFLAATAAVAQSNDRDLSLLHVPDGFVVEFAATDGVVNYPMFITYDDRGRVFVADSSGKDLHGKEMVEAPECEIALVEDTDGDGIFDKRTVFADKMGLPMGVLWYEGSVFVADPPYFRKLTDTDGDGVADKREVLLEGWNVLNTASLHGPFLGPEGKIYLTHGRHGFKINTKEGTTLEGTSSHIWRCNPDGTDLEEYCGGGFDNPVELVWLPNGDCIGTMTYYMDPKNGQRDALMHWVEGGVYPKPYHSTDDDGMIRTGPLMPTMTKFSRIAPAGLLRYSGANFGPQYQGNLFSAQFNPHRIQRHVIFDEGATHRTEDSDFLTSDDPDFFVTDIAQDRDGTLLFCDTGAWYVDACPISRVSKPDIKGGLYRIRKVDGGTAPEPPQATDRVWQLARDGAHSELRAMLQDSDPAVIAAAAHAVGVARDHYSVPQLVDLLGYYDPTVRRNAATALGRIGDASATSALLFATGGETDRFIEHALIYALIRLGDDATIVGGLESEDPVTRKSALIALDQLKSDKLHADAVTPFLADEDPTLREAGLWVASHHGDWSDTVTEYLAGRMLSTPFEGDDALRDALFAFAGSEGVQSVLGDSVKAGLGTDERLFALDTMEQAPIGWPDGWNDAIRPLLTDSDPAVQFRALTLVQTKAIDAFDDDILAIVDDASADADVRLAALAAVVSRHGELRDDRFAFLTSNLTADNPALRQAASKLLGRAALTEGQLEVLAKDYLPKADALAFATLVSAFEKSTAEPVGLALVEGLNASPDAAALIPSAALQALLTAYPAPVQKAAKPLLAKAEADAAARIERLAKIEPLIGTGDVGRGRRIFYGEKAACFTCHNIGGEGGTLGPDLTTIGEIRRGHDILESVLFPSASLVQDYETYRFEITDPDFGGTQTIEGLIGRQSADTITIRSAVGEERAVNRSDIHSMTPWPVSKMPEGMDTTLTQDELVDLLSFLMSCNGGGFLEAIPRDPK